jgi:N utilization substance protein A
MAWIMDWATPEEIRLMTYCLNAGTRNTTASSLWENRSKGVFVPEAARSTRRYAEGIQPELLTSANALDAFESPRFRYGARTEAAVYVGDLLAEQVPSLASGEVELVAIARRPGVLTKAAIRARPSLAPPLTIGIGADHIAAVRDRLDGERIHVVRWQRSAAGYIAEALGLGEPPPMQLLPALCRARVLLGEIDVRGVAGWRDLNVVLASTLTGWRIRLEPVAATPAWARLAAALHSRRPLTATVIGGSEHGPRVDVFGLYASLSTAAPDPRPGQELAVRVLRLDADEGRIIVTDRSPAVQRRLPLT